MKINTSLRGHGKWGDFLAGLLPLTWCSGILINSNFILRTIEWQHESALFTLRVHGRQWYWVYKYDLKTLTDKFNVFSVVGSMLKYKSTLSTYNTQKTYKKLLYIINSYTLNNLNTYWKNVQIKDWESTYNNSTYVKSVNKHSSMPYTRVSKKKNLNFFYNTKNINLYNKYMRLKLNIMPKLIKKNNSIPVNRYNYSNEALYDVWDTKNSVKKFKHYNTIKLQPILRSTIVNNNKIIDKINITDITDLDKKNLNAKLNKVLLSKKNIKKFKTKFKSNVLGSENLTQLYTTYYYLLSTKKNICSTPVIKELNNFNKPSHIVYKLPESRLLYIFKQKRIKKYQKLNFTLYNYTSKFYNINKKLTKNKYRYVLPLTFSIKTQTDKDIFFRKNIKTHDSLLLWKKYQLKKNQLQKNKLFTLAFSKRLLKTKKTVILPTKINVALITNSYDVAHSWFLPALGLKFDCVPGRSTHHTINVLHTGIYYGQCAEVCGRYHHHMPTRVSVVFYEHFKNWWKLKNINILNKFISKNNLNDSIKYFSYYILFNK